MQGGLRHFPCAGGYGDQPALLMEAFGIIATKAAEMRA